MVHGHAFSLCLEDTASPFRHHDLRCLLSVCCADRCHSPRHGRAFRFPSYSEASLVNSLLSSFLMIIFKYKYFDSLDSSELEVLLK